MYIYKAGGAGRYGIWLYICFYSYIIYIKRSDIDAYFSSFHFSLFIFFFSFSSRWDARGYIWEIFSVFIDRRLSLMMNMIFSFLFLFHIFFLDLWILRYFLWYCRLFDITPLFSSSFHAAEIRHTELPLRSYFLFRPFSPLFSHAFSICFSPAMPCHIVFPLPHYIDTTFLRCHLSPYTPCRRFHFLIFFLQSAAGAFHILIYRHMLRSAVFHREICCFSCLFAAMFLTCWYILWYIESAAFSDGAFSFSLLYMLL